MTTRFLFARHATCALTEHVLMGRVLDPPLDQRGEHQAFALAQRLSAEPVHAVLASPRRRAQQTAGVIAAQMRCLQHTTPALDEVDFGSWSAQGFASLAHDPDWRRWNQQRSLSHTPAGETIACVQSRVVGYLNLLARAFGDSTLVLVSHAEIIRAVIMHSLGASIDDYARFPIAPASLTSLRMTDAGLRLDFSNEQPGVEERLSA